MTADATAATSEVLDHRAPPRPRPRWLPWLIGAVLGVAMVGPGLGGGLLLNLDLIFVPEPPVPRGTWGLGPELPRRTPMFLAVAWAGAVGLGDVGQRVMLVGGIALAFVGGWRLYERAVRDAGGQGALLGLVSSGALLALSPFLLTRTAVGHFPNVYAVGLTALGLPWLLRPGTHPRRAFLWACALACTGIIGGTYAIVALAVGAIADLASRTGGLRALFRTGAIAAVSQSVWIIPSLVVAWSIAGTGRTMVGASDFATRVQGIDGAGRLAAGLGFWQDLYQIGHPGLIPPDTLGEVTWWAEFLLLGVAGWVLIALALAGTPLLPAAWRTRAAALAAIGYLVAAASAMPVVKQLWDSFTLTPLGSPLREGQRTLGLYLVWMAPAAVLGAGRIHDHLLDRGQEARARAAAPDRPAVTQVSRWRGAVASVVAVLPLAIAVGLSAHGWWGLDGQLQPHPVPDDWAAARREILAEPGTVLALPWYQYLHLDVAGERLTLNPMPFYLGGDVAVASDLRLGEDDGGRERGDPRERRLRRIVEEMKAGLVTSESLADSGVMWVLLLDEVDVGRYASLYDDPGLEVVHRGVDATLFRVTDRAGQVETPSGDELALEPLVQPFNGLEASGPAVWGHPGSRGWLRGAEQAEVTRGGLLALPSGDGPLWYWPAVVVLLADIAWISSVVLVARRDDRATDDRLAGDC